MTDFQFEPQRKASSNLHADSECKTCDGIRFVVYSRRAPEQSSWMRDHGIKPSKLAIDELAACPDCNPVDVSFSRHDGTRFVAPDPAKVRERA